jgi:hypothetical protein
MSQKQQDATHMEIITAAQLFDRKEVPKWLQVEEMSFKEHSEI